MEEILKNESENALSVEAVGGVILDALDNQCETFQICNGWSIFAYNSFCHLEIDLYREFEDEDGDSDEELVKEFMLDDYYENVSDIILDGKRSIESLAKDIISNINN